MYSIGRYYNPICVFWLGFQYLCVMRVRLWADDAECGGEDHQPVEQANHNHQEEYLRHKASIMLNTIPTYFKEANEHI